MNCKRGGNDGKKGDKNAQEEIKKFQSLTLQPGYNLLLLLCRIKHIVVVVQDKTY